MSRILSDRAGVEVTLFEKIYLDDEAERRQKTISPANYWDPPILARCIFEALDDSDGLPLGWVSYRPLSSIWASNGLYIFLEWSRGQQSKEIARELKENADDVKIYVVKGLATQDLKNYVAEHGFGITAREDEFVVGYIVSFKSKPLLIDDVRREFCRATDWLEYVKITNKGL